MPTSTFNSSRTEDPSISPASRGHIDRAIFAASLFLLACYGVVAIHTSSITTRQEGFEPIYLSRHLGNLAIATTLSIWAAFRPARFWLRWTPIAGLLTVVALVLVLTPGIGISGGGATRWIRVPGFTVQPSEWAKITIPLIVAATLCTRKRAPGIRKSLSRNAIMLGAIGLILALVLKQPDLGTCLLLIMTAATAFWIAGVRFRWFALAGIGILPIGLAMSLKGYQLRRIQGLLDTWQDWTDAPYQLRQSLIALGEGGLNGVGLGRGWQKLSFLPESHTDFVIAVVGEEMGFIAISTIAMLWLAVLLSGASMLKRSHNRFSATVGCTLLVMLVMQAALNVGVVAAVIPPTGIPHPFLSYGGNSLLVTSLSVGMIWSVTATNRHEALAERLMAADLANSTAEHATAFDEDIDSPHDFDADGAAA